MELSKLLKKVAKFQMATGQIKFPTATPENQTIEEAMLRFELMKEENDEFIVASQNYDLVEQLDACADMLYILAGTINQLGFKLVIEEAFNRVHKNNMTKVGPDGKVSRSPSGKILKPEGFVPVDLSDLITNK
jgi:predicted HAD superfamily Cof-like phosphohydrolase